MDIVRNWRLWVDWDKLPLVARHNCPLRQMLFQEPQTRKKDGAWIGRKGQGELTVVDKHLPLVRQVQKSRKLVATIGRIERGSGIGLTCCEQSTLLYTTDWPVERIPGQSHCRRRPTAGRRR